MVDEFDPFGDPHSEEFQESHVDETTEIHDTVGASPVNPADVAGKPNRKGLYIIVGVVVVFISLWVFAKRMESSSADKVAESKKSGDVATAEVSSRSHDDDTLGILADVDAQTAAAIAERDARTSGASELVTDPGEKRSGSPSSMVNASDLFGGMAPPNPGASGGSASPGTVSDEVISQALAGGDAGLMVPSQPSSGQNSPQSTNSSAAEGSNYGSGAYIEPGFVMTQSSREIALEEQLRKEAERKAREEAKAAERERLKQAGTLIAENTERGTQTSLGHAQGPLNDLLVQSLGPDGAPLAAALQAVENESNRTLQGTPTPSGGVAPPSSTAIQVTPGIRVPAVTLSEYIADQSGSGIVEARLTSGLRDRGRLILPAGTRAYGQASATGGAPGVEARVAIKFHTFVTPSGEVFRGQLTAQAADPQTLAMSIKGSVNNRYLSKIARGGAATAIDLFLTKDTQQRSIFDAPSPRDRAIDDARGRLSGVLGADIGNEATNTSTVHLPAETSIMLIFGLSES